MPEETESLSSHIKKMQKKTTGKVAFFKKLKLFDFSFFEDYVLTDFWIKFFDFHFFRHSTFVLSSGIEITCTS